MEIYSYIIYMIGMLISAYYTDMLIALVVKRKYKRYWYTIIYTMLILLQVYLADYLIKSLKFKYAYFYIANWLFIYLLYKGTILKKVLAYMELVSVVMFTELIGAQLVFGLIGDLTTEDLTGLTDIRIFVNFACAMVLVIIVYIFMFIQKKIKFSISINKMVPIIMVFLSQAIVGSAYNLIRFEVEVNSSKVFLFYIFVVLMIDLWLLRSMSLLEIKEDTEEKIKNFEKETELVSEYYSELSENINNLESIKNEYNDELKNIYEITGKISEFDKGKEDKNRKFKEEITANKSNVLVNNIISNVKAQLDLLNAPYKIDVDVTEKINMDYGDLSSILINIFGNAIEAIEIYVNEAKEGKSVKNKEKYFLEGIVEANERAIKIEVKNVKSSKQKVRLLDDKYITFKKDKRIHGYGMQIIKRTADKYNGNMEVEYTSESFINSVKISLS